MIDSVPLIQNANDAQQINASIIAMKKASRELDEKIAQFNKLLSQEITNREKAITEAINSLDVPSVGGSGKYISAISETDGKINATASDITSTVSSGNSQPVTSGGVANAIQGVISLPTDAVLHYSFDEVPDYPDGNADVRREYGNTYTNLTEYCYGNATQTITNVNGNLHCKSTVSYGGIYLRNDVASSKISIVKVKVIKGTVAIGTLGDVKSIGTWVVSRYVDSSFYIVSATAEETEWELEYIYIGDGSYSTPIIDNANGQWNGTNSGSIVVQGVSGKAIRSFKNSYKSIRNTNFKIKPPYSFSLWLKFPSELEQGQNIIDGRDGTVGSDEGLVVNQNRSIEVGPSGGSFVITDANVVPVNIWSNIVVVTTVEGSGNRYKVYVNGSLKKDSAVTNSNQGFKQLTVNGRYQALQQGQAERELDDFLFFGRALSDTEVLALYQNKANTPKYYSWADWKLSNT